VYFAFTSQNITILYIFSQLFLSLVFWVTLRVEIFIIPSMKFSPMVNSVQL